MPRCGAATSSSGHRTVGNTCGPTAIRTIRGRRRTPGNIGRSSIRSPVRTAADFWTGSPLPLWLDLGDLRVIHACWHEPSISVVQQRCGTSTPFGELSHLVDAITEGDPLHHAVETLLTGPENLVEHGQPEYRDKYVFRGTTRGWGGGTVARRRCVTSQRWGELHHRLRAAVSGATRTGTGRCREFRQDGGVYVTVGGYVLTHRSTVCVFEQPPTLTSQPDAELAEAE